MTGIGPNFNLNLGNKPKIDVTNRNDAVGGPQEASEAPDKRPEGETLRGRVIVVHTDKNGKMINYEDTGYINDGHFYVIVMQGDKVVKVSKDKMPDGVNIHQPSVPPT